MFMVTMPEISSPQVSLLTQPQGGSSNQTIAETVLGGGSSGTDFPVIQTESAQESHSLQTAGERTLFLLPESVIDNPYWLGLAVLGQKGMERLYSFATDYQDGWGDGSGRALNADAYKALFVFMKNAPINISSRPSIFLTEEGGLEVAWDDAEGNDVRVEFTPIGVEYYFAKTGRQGCVKLDQVQILAENFESFE
jgi:hypothetical protein